MAWRKNFGAELLKRAKASAGGNEAWSRLLTPALKEAFIAEQVLGVVAAQDESMAIRSNDVHDLWLDARRAARLL
jgi:hypothetical protein